MYSLHTLLHADTNNSTQKSNHKNCTKKQLVVQLNGLYEPHSQMYQLIKGYIYSHVWFAASSKLFQSVVYTAVYIHSRLIIRPNNHVLSWPQILNVKELVTVRANITQGSKCKMKIIIKSEHRHIRTTSHPHRSCLYDYQILENQT